MTLNYPLVRKESFVETIHGKKIEDPYRYLEDLDSDETKQFVKNQQALTDSFLKDAPNKDDIRKSLLDMWNYEKFKCPFKKGNKYYYFKNNGLDNQDIMFELDDLNKMEDAKVFLDPNQLSEKGTSSINVFEFSNNSKWFAYTISDGGSDWLRIKIRNVETKEELKEELNFCRFTTIKWTKDDQGFFYSGYLPTEKQIDSESKIHKIFYHKLNTDQSEDFIAIDFPTEPKALLLARMSTDFTTLHIQLNEECRDAKWYYAKIDQLKGKLTTAPIIDKIEAEYDYLYNDGSLIYYRTNKNAPNFKIARLNLDNLAEPVVDIVLEHEHNVLNKAYCFDKDKLLLVYLKDVKQIIEIRKIKDGSLVKEFTIPIGSITNVECNLKSSEFFFYFESFLIPGRIYYLDFATMTDLKVFKEIKLKNFDSNDYVTKQVFFKTRNGLTNIPMFIVHSKDLELNGDNLAYLYAYGGFNIPILPVFDLSKILLVKNFKGVFCVVNARGGGEYGTQWYNSGRLLNKQNTLDDIQSAAQYLIEQKYTTNKKLTIEGISNGGLMMQICSNQRPDLFGCVITRVGAHDLLRFDKFTFGYLWRSDYGKTESKMHFMNLLKLSPLQNIPINAAAYPATFILTADHDDRVVPSHSFKLASHLQDKIGKRLTSPILLRIDVDVGHSNGKSTDTLINETTDVFSFIQKTLGLKFYH